MGRYLDLLDQEGRPQQTAGVCDPAPQATPQPASHWLEAYQTLRRMDPPAGFSTERWWRITDAVRVFADRWGAEADRCGWTDLDLLGCHPERPDARFDYMGLALLLDRHEVVGIDGRGADLVSVHGGSKLRFRRRSMPPDAVILTSLKTEGKP